MRLATKFAARLVPALLLAASMSLLPMPGFAADPQKSTALSPSQIVDGFQKALRADDGRGALDFMARDVTVFEQGFMEDSRDNWGAHQLGDSHKFARDTERRVLRRETGQEGNMAWVMSTTLTTGNFDGRKLELIGTETMLLRRQGDDWKIAHIHWSAHSTAEEAAAPAASKPPAKPAAKPATPAKKKSSAK